MKKIFLYSAILVLVFYTQITGIIAQSITENVRYKGKISPNSENEDNEPDPPYKEIATGPSKKMSNTGNQKQVSEIENGLQIVKDIIDKMIEREYSFSLLSQHKYMINGCLGFKVSSGQFNVKFNNPVITVGELGKIKIKLGLNKIYFSALKIRLRPCTKPEHLLDPCHFGKKFEIGGEANDVSITTTIDIVARGLAGSAGLCFFALEDNVPFKWHIGSVNLKPLQNNLDYLAKEMVEDGLNSGFANVLYMKFIDISKEVIPKYFSECENAYSVKEKLNNSPTEAIAGNINANSNSGNNNSDNNKSGNSKPDNNNSDNNASGNESEKWVITPVSTMRGVLGGLNIKFPADVERNILIHEPGTNKFLRSVSRNDKTYSIAPGTYNFVLTTVPVENVPIQKGHETRLKAGFLNIVSEGHWELYNHTKENLFTTGNKTGKIVLPVGNYQLKLGGDFFPAVIKDGETVEL